MKLFGLLCLLASVLSHEVKMSRHYQGKLMHEEIYPQPSIGAAYTKAVDIDKFYQDFFIKSGIPDYNRTTCSTEADYTRQECKDQNEYVLFSVLTPPNNVWIADVVVQFN